MALKRPHTFPTSWTRTRHHASIVGQLPHFDGFVETTTDKVPSIGRKGDRINTVFMTFGAVEPGIKITVASVPYSDTFVERSCCNVLTFRGNGHSSDAVLDTEVQNLSPGVDVPNAHRTIAATGSNVLPVSGKVEGIDILLMAGESVPYSTCRDVPNLSPELLAHPKRAQS